MTVTLMDIMGDGLSPVLDIILTWQYLLSAAAVLDVLVSNLDNILTSVSFGHRVGGLTALLVPHNVLNFLHEASVNVSLSSCPG